MATTTNITTESVTNPAIDAEKLAAATPNVSNPSEPSNPESDTNIGNTNGIEQEHDAEVVKTPTASDTIALKRKQLNDALAKLESQETIATLADIAIELLNASKNEKLADARNAVDGDTNITIMFQISDRKFRYASLSDNQRVVSINPPAATTNSGIRNWFKTITSPENVTHQVVMKTETTMDLDKLTEIVGVDFKKDKNGHSLSHVGKQNLLKSKNWTWENDHE